MHTTDEVVSGLGEYLALVARWNRRINLTAFALDTPSDDAIDRLLVEPLAAARHLLPGDRVLVDVGSGSGSPAIPLKIAAPYLRLVLVEARIRKSAFLREAARVLGLREVAVETRRLGADWKPAELAGKVDVVTLRAVRVDGPLWKAIEGLAGAAGRVFLFGKSGISPKTRIDDAKWEFSRPGDPTDPGFMTIVKRR